MVAVDYGLHGSKGSLYLGQSRETAFRGRAFFRQTETLSEAQMAKVTGAKDFTVQLYAVRRTQLLPSLLRQAPDGQACRPAG